MKAVKYVTLCGLLAVWMVALVGCKGKKTEEPTPPAAPPSAPAAEAQPAPSAPAVEVKADETVPVADVKAQADKMDASQLRAAALTYKEAIAAKKAELDKLAAQLKEIPVTDLLGDKAKQLKANIDTVTKTIDALKTRFDVFYAKLKAVNGDLSGLQL